MGKMKMLVALFAVATIVPFVVASQRARERQSLINLYTSTQGDGWVCGAPGGDCSSANMSAPGHNATSWCLASRYHYGTGTWMVNITNSTVDSTICTWYGVSCDEHKNVVAICFLFNNLNGTLPDLDLPHLEFFTIVGEPHLKGDLPASYSTSLPSIFYIDLGKTSIEGSLPASWGAMKNLKSLYLDFTRIGGTLPPSWGGMSSLDILHVADTPVSGTLPASWVGMNNLSLLVLYNALVTGTLPSSWAGLKNLKSLMLQNNSLAGTVPSSWLRIRLNVLQLNNNNFSYMDPKHFPSTLKLLTLSCQNQSNDDVVRCLEPPGVNGSSLVALTTRLKNLSVIDVMNTTSVFTYPVLWEDHKDRIQEFETFGAMIVSGLSVFLILLGLGVHKLYRLGYSQVTPKHFLPYLDFRPGVQPSKAVGAITLGASIVCVYFVVNEVVSYCYGGQTLSINTGPFDGQGPTRNLDFIFNLSVGNKRAEVVVNDKWYVDRREFLGSYAIRSPRVMEYRTPIGWSSNGAELVRNINFSFYIGEAGGFKWTLGSTATAMPFQKLMLKKGWYTPTLVGDFTGVGHKGEIQTPGVSLHDVAGYLVPNRMDIKAAGRNLKQCLEYVDINVQATPFNVSVDEDWASGTEGQLFQMYLLSEAVRSQGHMSTKPTCGNTTIRMSIVRKDFMVNYRVTRWRKLVSLLGSLLGAVAGIANSIKGVVAAYYSVLAWWKSKRAPQENELLTLSVDESDTGSWIAQRDWNHKSELLHAESRNRIDKSEAQIERLTTELEALRVCLDERRSV